MPRMAEIHIQKIEPTPPMEMAVAIPATFPVPTWAATAVARAWKELTLDLPSSPFFRCIAGPKAYFIARLKWRICGKPR